MVTVAEIGPKRWIGVISRRPVVIAGAPVYNAAITRSGAEALMPEDVQHEIVDGVAEQSAIMRMARRLPNMSRNQRRMPVLGTLITAGFINTQIAGSNDTGFKATSSELWNNKFINAEELAVIVPIPENVLNDADYDVWAEIKPRIIESFGIAFDAAVAFGTGAPTSWPTSMRQASINAGTRVIKGGAGADVFDDVFGATGLLNKLESVGFMATGFVSPPAYKGTLRGLRDAVGQPIFRSGSQAQTPQGALQNITIFELDGMPVFFPMNGAWDPTQASLFAADWRQVVYSVRQDVTYKILDQAAIFDPNGNLQYNLPQQDMVALRATMRLGWQVPNPINRLQPNETNRYPVAVYTPTA